MGKSLIFISVFFILLLIIPSANATKMDINNKTYDIHLQLAERDKNHNLIAYVEPDLFSILRPDIFEACLAYVPVVQIVKDNHTYLEKTWKEGGSFSKDQVKT